MQKKGTDKTREKRIPEEPRMEDGAEAAAETKEREEKEREERKKAYARRRRQERRLQRRAFLLGAVVAVILFLAADILLAVCWLPGGTKTPSSLQTSRKLTMIDKLIERVYVGGEVDEEKLAAGMYRGMISALGDPYAGYYTEEEYRTLSQSQKGYYKGIGVTIEKAEEIEGILVREVSEGGPASEAGIQAGDVILEVDGISVLDKSVSETGAMIKNREDPTVTLRMRRGGSEEIYEATMEIKELETETVKGRMLEEKIGYLQILQFTGKTSDQFATVYAQLQEEGLERLVIDLRGNPGGLLSAVCNTLRQILPEGLIVYTENKKGERKEYTCAGKTPIDIPLAVLVDEDTASAAEIFTGAVKDYGIGTVVGTQTYGKGIVQDFYTLPDKSVVKLTVAHYYTPKGNDIHGVGITPDVNMEGQNSADGADSVLEKAIEILINWI